MLLAATAAVCALFVGAMSIGNSQRMAYADLSLDAEERAFMTLLNNYRTDNGVPPLLIDGDIQEAAEWMSIDMGQNAYFSHTDSQGQSPWTRMCNFGYCFNTWKGENIAAGYVTGAQVFQGWKDSPGHNSNMLGANYRVMGLARVYTSGSPFGWYWTNDFGGYIQSSPPPAPTNTPAPTAPPSPTRTASPSPSVSAHPTASPTPVVTNSPTLTPTPSVSPTPPVTSTPTATAAPTPYQTASPAPTTPVGPTYTAPPSRTHTPTPVPSGGLPPGITAADVDCDDDITGFDSLTILKWVAQISVETPGCDGLGYTEASAKGDVDCDGSLDAVDALSVLKFAAGLSPSSALTCS